VPNIEIHGLGLRTLANRIFSFFKGKKYAKDMVVTDFHSSVRDREGKDSPFVRVVNTNEIQENEEIIKILKENLNPPMDIELMIISKFIPK